MGCKQSSLITVFVLAATVVLPASLAWSQSTVPADIVSAGKADFMTYCATCHGRKGVGDGPVANQLITNPADLTQLKSGNGGTFPEDRVHMAIDGRKTVLSHGTRDMPVWGNWFKFVARASDPTKVDDETAEIIAALRVQGLIEYLKTIQND
ncbi:MAG: cytochrome C [Rhizobiales bacterium]|nr:cytochrome C [Hyphomicrobiales bacterium]